MISHWKGTGKKPVIAYAVAGQGRGHVAKSVAIAQMLRNQYDVVFFAGGEAYDFLIRAELPVVQIPTPRFSFKNNAIHIPGTIRRNFSLVLGLRKILAKIGRDLQELNPALIISDFESLLPRAGRKLSIPVLQISHQVVLLCCKTPAPLKERFNRFKAWAITRIMISHFDRALGVSFFEAPIKKRFRNKVAILPPALRETLIERTTTKRERGEHILVYLSCKAFGWVMDKLANHPNFQFVVYGLDEENLPEYPNVIHKPISPEGFMDDLLGAKAVIANGGHNFISEAAWLDLPILSFWVEGQFEQWLNAWYVEKMGLGRMVDSIQRTDLILAEFLNALSHSPSRPKARIPDGNQRLHEGILAFLKENQHHTPSRLRTTDAVT